MGNGIHARTSRWWPCLRVISTKEEPFGFADRIMIWYPITLLSKGTVRTTRQKTTTSSSLRQGKKNKNIRKGFENSWQRYTFRWRPQILPSSCPSLHRAYLITPQDVSRQLFGAVKPCCCTMYRTQKRNTASAQTCWNRFPLVQFLPSSTPMDNSDSTRLKTVPGFPSQHQLFWLHLLFPSTPKRGTTNYKSRETKDRPDKRVNRRPTITAM